MIITALPPAFPASLILELLASRVVPVPFDESAVVEGTFFPTTASSLDAVVHNILAARLKRNLQIKKRKSRHFNKVLDYKKLAMDLLLVDCAELRRFRATVRVPFD